MKVEAATLSGGEVNQDYYAYGDTYALVLDGASSFLPEQTSMDAVRYVKALGGSLSSGLESCSLEEIPELVAASIREIAELYELDEESSPNSTVVIAKWNQREVATYVLGDSSCLVIDAKFKLTEITDSRMAQFGNEIREEYRRRLTAGSGFDDEHKQLLRQIQHEQKLHRNVKGGYWIAGANSDAGFYGRTQIFCLCSVQQIWLMSDGGLSSFQRNKEDLYSISQRISLDQILMKQYKKEADDPMGILYPRSKIHDDKTIIVIEN